MAIWAECPICRKRQSVKKKVRKCGENLDQAKQAKRFRYWINFRLSGGNSGASRSDSPLRTHEQPKERNLDREKGLKCCQRQK